MESNLGRQCKLEIRQKWRNIKEGTPLFHNLTWTRTMATMHNGLVTTQMLTIKTDS